MRIDQFHNNHLEVLQAMEDYGGSFVEHLAKAWRVADCANHEKLSAAFSDIYEKYHKFCQTRRK